MSTQITPSSQHAFERHVSQPPSSAKTGQSIPEPVDVAGPLGPVAGLEPVVDVDGPVAGLPYDDVEFQPVPLVGPIPYEALLVKVA